MLQMRMEAIERLQALTATIQEICSTTGTPGLSIGILHQGEIIYKQNIGFRDVEANLPTTSDTIYHLGSLSKQFTSTLAGLLVSQGQVGFDTPIHTILPEVKSLQNRDASDNITLQDLLSHRHGLAPKQDIWYQSLNRYLLPKHETLNVFNNLEIVKPFRTEMTYSNFGYAMVSEVLENVTGKSWGSLLKKQVLEPLDLSRTFVDEGGRADEDYAAAYMALDDASFYRIERPQVQDGTIMDAAVGVRSTINDLLIFYDSILTAWAESYNIGLVTAPTSPLRLIPEITSAYIPLSHGSHRERSYGLGWVRTQLPGPLGTISYNPILVDMPDVCRSSPSRLTFHHQGSLPGYTSSVNLFPESQSAIVVLTNSLGISDCADWVGQLLTETLFDEKRPNDYVALARKSAARHVAIYNDVEQELAQRRAKNPGTPRPLRSYTGKYFNKAGNWHIDVSLLHSSSLHDTSDMHHDGRLVLTFQSLYDDPYYLTWYQDDIFTWHITRNEGVKRGRFTFDSALYQEMRFGAGSNGDIISLTWSHEPDLPEGETFTKQHA